MSKPVRIGIIGAGNIVKTRHLPALQAMEEVEIVAVCNSSLEVRKKALASGCVALVIPASLAFFSFSSS